MTDQTNPTLPADGDADDPTTWSFASTVDVFDGYHHTGAIFRRLVDFRDDATEYGHEPDDSRSMAEHAQWWAEVLEPIHDGRCRLAELDPATTDPIVRRVLGLPADADEWDVQRAWEDISMDLENLAVTYRRLLDALAAGTIVIVEGW